MFTWLSQSLWMQNARLFGSLSIVEYDYSPRTFFFSSVARDSRHANSILYRAACQAASRSVVPVIMTSWKEGPELALLQRNTVPTLHLNGSTV